MFRPAVILAAIFLTTLSQSNSNAGSFSKQTLTYKRIGSDEIHADVYRPARNDPRPVILWIHGGALIFGDRGMLPEDERQRFLRAGYVVVSIDYRLAPETKLPEILDDVADAYRWVREKGPALFVGDPNRVAVIGQSAGAYLALMAGARVHPSPKAIVSFYGYGDIAGDWYRRPSPFFLNQRRVTKEEAFRTVSRHVISQSPVDPREEFYIYCRQTGLWPQEVAGFNPFTEPGKFHDLSPEQLVGPTYPPTFLLHGDQDTEVPYQMSERMAAVLERQKVRYRFSKMVGFNHLFDVFPDGMPPLGKATGLQNRKVATAFKDVLAFLALYLDPRAHGESRPRD